MHGIVHYVLAGSLLLAPVAWADDEHGNGKGKGKGHDNGVEERDKGRESNLFEAQIVKVADLGAGGLGAGFPAVGNDALTEGEVSVKANRKVEVELEGAAANGTYNVFFCRFVAANNCVSLAPATLQTNASGNFEGNFDFPAGSGNVLAGVFLFVRGGNAQFISGIQMPAAAVDLGVDIELRGTITSINGANQTFRLETFPVDITVNASTKFSGLERFSDLKTGQNVEVEGIAAAGGVTASRIKLKD